jgi:23S rRNA pseudouridine2605 synthase
MMTKTRHGLARTLSKMGYCSRSQAARLIRRGRVTVNGRRVHDPETPIESKDMLTLNGESVSEREKIYLAMNKPRGIITTASDEKGRRTVYDLLAPGQAWVGPVGRLDKASEGLLLLTNDSEWAARVTDPASNLEKTYHAQVNSIARDDLLGRIAEGVTAEGEYLRAKTARLLQRGEKNSWLELTLTEGRNRHIRRLLGALGLTVLRLVRVSIGPLRLGNLEKGKVRPLTPTEVQTLDGRAASSERAAKLEAGTRKVRKNNGRMPIDVGCGWQRHAPY